MKNRVELLCEMLGVELEEEFMMRYAGSLIYKIDNDGIKYKSITCESFNKSSLGVNDLLKDEVIKLPWKPKEGEGYYYLSVGNHDGYGYLKRNTQWDERVISRAEVYRTEEEAIAAVKAKGWVVE